MRQAPPRTLALTPDQLYRACDPASLGFDTTASIAPMPLPFAQPRAARAIELAIGMQRAGYNVFVMGAPGAGKRALVTGLIEALPHPATAPPDWVYLNNFAAPHKPLAVSLPAGQGRLLAHDMAQLVEELQSAIPALFESDEYRSRAAQIESEFTERHERAFSELGEEAGAQSIGLLRTPAGFSFAPLKNGEVIAAGDYAALPEAEKARLQGLIEGLQRKLEAIIRKMLDWRRELRQRVKQLNGEMTLLAVGHFVDELKQRYAHVAKLAAYFDAVQRDVIDNADDFRGAASPAAGPPALHPEQPSFHRYAVNVMVDHGAPNGAPAVLEELPTYPNLVGRVDHASQFGTLVTDFTLVKPGALHRANGGCLMLDARRLLMQPYAWEGLKRALRTSAIRIESLAEMYSLLSTASLEPEPIPLAVKVVLFGERELYYMLSACDPEFPELFKIVADFDDRYDRSPENVASYARMLASITQRGGLLPLESAAAARVVDHGARSASDSKKLDANIRAVSDLLCEADQYARAASRAAVSREDIERAIAARRARADRFHNRLHEAIVRGTLMIATSGERVGQVNGLSVYELGGQAFAEPTRITATTRLGDGKVIDVQREVELGGAIHSKGVLILSSFLAARYSQNQQHALSASLVFEQTYGVVDGDSASLAELCALISSLADVPIRQSLALTGSVNQLGEAQAIGAVNEKIEGYFELCSARGLDGRHGVIIPAANVEHLMLDVPVVDAVRSGLFAIYAVKSVDEAIELLTGMPAGVTDNAGAFPPDTVNGRVTRRLRMLSEARASQVRIAVTGMNHGRQRSS